MKKQTAVENGNGVVKLSRSSAVAFSFYDSLSQTLSNQNTALAEVVKSEKALERIDKKEFGKLAEDLFLHMRLSKEANAGERLNSKVAGMEADAARQRFCDIAMNLDASIRLVPPSEKEASAKLQIELAKIKESLFTTAFPADSLPATFKDRNGKDQPSKGQHKLLKTETYKWGSMPQTKYESDIISKFTSAVKKHGWEAICPKGKYIGDALVQKLDKAAATPAAGSGTPGANSNDPLGAARAALHTLQVRLAKVPNDATKIALLNEITMAAATILIATNAAMKKAESEK